MYSEHDDGASQVLGTLRAEHGSAPTDHHRKNSCIMHTHVASSKNSCTIPELHRKNLGIIHTHVVSSKNSNAAYMPDLYRENLGVTPPQRNL